MISATRFHDLRGGASVCRVGALFRHAALSDNARPFGPEQGQLECHGARGIGELRGGGVRTGPCHRRAQFQSLISGKPRVMTPQRSQNTSTALSQTSYVTFELLATHLQPTTDDLFSSFSFIRRFNLFNFKCSFALQHRAIHRYLIWLLLQFCFL